MAGAAIRGPRRRRISSSSRQLKPEVVVLGTGPAQRFPRPELARALAASGAGVEVMDSKAACRTYNILAAEGRSVVAAILLEVAHSSFCRETRNVSDVRSFS